MLSTYVVESILYTYIHTCIQDMSVPQYDGGGLGLGAAGEEVEPLISEPLLLEVIARPQHTLSYVMYICTYIHTYSII